MTETYHKTAQDIIDIIGIENIISVTHCQTRLRFVLKDRESVDDKLLENLSLVKGVFFNGGQYQVILGTGIVNKVYQEIENLGIQSVSKAEQKAYLKENEKGMKRVMRILSEIFIPIVPVIAATVSQLFGVSEPVLFGLLIRWNLRPLLCVLFTSGIGGAVLSAFHIQSNSYGLAVIPSFLMYIYSAHQFVIYALVALASVGLCFILTSIFAIPDDILVPEAIVAEEIKAAQAEAQTLTDQLITAPVSGHVVSLTSVADPVFASEMMGKGAAIIPSDGNVYAPFYGKMSIVAETGHAYGIETADGAEVLIHIGIDTVSLAGAYFQTKVKQDQIVKKGTLLGTFDITGIKDSGLDPTVMVIVTNTLAYMDVAQIVKSHTAIQLGQQLLSLSTDD